MKWLRGILEQQNIEADQITSIVEEAKKQKLIPKERFDEVNTQLKEANKTITNVNSELETIKGKVQNDEVLKQQIADLQGKQTKLVEDYESKIKGMKILDYVKGEMVKDLKDPKYFDLLYKEVDQEKIAIGEDGSVSGFDLSPFQEKYPDLFGAAAGGTGSLGAPSKTPPKGAEESTGARLAKMSTTSEVKENPYF